MYIREVCGPLIPVYETHSREKYSLSLNLVKEFPNLGSQETGEA